MRCTTIRFVMHTLQFINCMQPNHLVYIGLNAARKGVYIVSACVCVCECVFHLRVTVTKHLVQQVARLPADCVGTLEGKVQNYPPQCATTLLPPCRYNGTLKRERKISI